MKESTKVTLLLTMVCVLLLAACGGEPAPASTPTAVATLADTPAEPAPAEEPTAEPTEELVEEVTPTAIGSADEEPVSTGIEVVTVENVSFQTAPLLSSVWSGGLVEDNSDPDVPPDMLLGPRRVVISGTVELGDGSPITPYLFVYQVSDLAGHPEQDEADALAELLAADPEPIDLAATPALPYLPRVNAAQAVHGAEQTLGFGNGSGIRYVTAFAQDPSPFLGHSFLYTFQGLTSDGQHYVALVVPLTTGLFPAELPKDFDEDAHIAGYGVYLVETQATLTGAAPDDFAPDLSNLDAVVQSITIGESADDEAGATPPAALTGTVWQLVTIIDADGGEGAVDDPSQYTLAFGENWRVAVQADCNQGGGPYDASDGALTIGMLISTRAACPEGSLYDVYMEKLGMAASYEVADGVLTITLADEAGALEFVAAEQEETEDAGTTPPADLVDIVWQLSAIIGADGSQVTPGDPNQYTLTFGSDWRVAVQADCNQGGGPYDTDGSRLVIGMLISTLAACPEGSLYDVYMEKLGTAASYQVTGDVLTITLADDDGVMQFAVAE